MSKQMYWVATFKGEEENPSDVVMTLNLDMGGVRRMIQLCKTSEFNCVWLEMPPDSHGYKWLRFIEWFKRMEREVKKVERAERDAHVQT